MHTRPPHNMHMFIHSDFAINLTAAACKDGEGHVGHVDVEIMAKLVKEESKIRALCEDIGKKNGVKGEFKLRFIFPKKNDREQIVLEAANPVCFSLFAGDPERVELVNSKLADGLQLKNHEMLPKVICMCVMCVCIGMCVYICVCLCMYVCIEIHSHMSWLH
jgi:hypothetical protein